MKNRLLAAFLTLATVPFFANTKPTNAELLTHLKQAKTDLQGFFVEVSEDYEQDYKKRKNEGQALYDLIQNNIPSNYTDACFNALCKQTPANETIYHLYVTIWGRFIEDNFTNNHKEEITAILSNFINDYQDTLEALSCPTRTYDPNKYTPEERIINFFFGSGNRNVFFMMVIIENIRNGLLEKIDTKIAELEAQQ